MLSTMITLKQMEHMVPGASEVSWNIKANKQISTYIHHRTHKTKKISVKFITNSHLCLEKDWWDRWGKDREERKGSGGREGKKRERKKHKISHWHARAGCLQGDGNFSHCTPGWQRQQQVWQDGTKDGWWCHSNQSLHNAVCQAP